MFSSLRFLMLVFACSVCCHVCSQTIHSNSMVGFIDIGENRESSGRKIKTLNHIPLEDVSEFQEIHITRYWGEEIVHELYFEHYSKLNFPKNLHVPNLKKLFIDTAIIKTEDLEEISKLIQLRSLSIHSFPTSLPRDKKNERTEGDSTSYLNPLVGLTHLEDLDLNWFSFQGADLRFLSNLPHLKKLSIDHGTFSKDNIEQLLYTQLTLDELTIRNSNIKGASWNIFASSVKRLMLQNSSISASDLSKIGALDYLEHLNLEETKVSGQSIGKLLTSPKLKTLSLSRTNMRNADFSQLPSLLEELDLRYSELSIASFQTLYSLVNLKKLNLSGTQSVNIQVSMIKALQEALPDCEILY